MAGLTFRSKPVPDSGLRHDVPRSRWILLELCAQRVNRRAQQMQILLFRPFSPHLCRQPVVRQQPSAVSGQHHQQRGFVSRQLHRRAAKRDHAALQIHRQVAGREYARVPLLFPCDSGANPLQKIPQPAGLCKVIVRAGVKRRNLVALCVPHRQDDNRRVAQLSKPARYHNPIQIRQAQIKNNHIRMQSLDASQNVLSRGGFMHREPSRRKQCAYRPSNDLLVIGNQNARTLVHNSMIEVLRSILGQ